MLKGMRAAGRSWLGKLLVAVLFSLLILSFAVWGIGDIFRGSPRNTVATVGDAEITAEEYRNAYQSELQRVMRQARQSISPERARLLGIDSQVLSRLVTEASLDQRAKALGLSVSDQTVVRAITEDPSFKGANGQFDRALFENALRDNGLNEPGFVREQRDLVTRLQLAEAISGALPVPLAAREAIHRYSTERRTVNALTLPASVAGEIPAPTEEELKAFFEQRKAQFRAPEYRSVNALVLTPEAVTKPEAVSDEDARRRYEQNRARFGAPERRTIQQIVFPSVQEAEAAFARTKEGLTFDALAEERNIAERDRLLGTFTKAEVFDPAVADAAFALAEGAVSGPVQGRFGTILIRVTKVEPESVKPFEQVAAELRGEIAAERAKAEVDTVHDAIEDLRASARPLAEIAKEKNLPLVTVPAVSRAGEDPAGQPVQTLPERDALLNAAFQTDIGADNEALRTKAGGYVWYEVTKVDPARDRTLDEVRDEVVAQWRGEQVAQRLSERAAEITKRLEAGETLEAVASSLGLEAKPVSAITRSSAAQGDLTTDVIGRVFATPVGKAASAPGAGDSRIVFKVASASVPPFVTTTQEAGRVEEQLRLYMSDDLIAEYIAQVQKDVGVQVNQEVARRAIGGEL